MCERRKNKKFGEKTIKNAAEEEKNSSENKEGTESKRIIQFQEETEIEGDKVINKVQEELNISNVIANDKYTIVMDQYGNGYSKYNKQKYFW